MPKPYEYKPKDAEAIIIRKFAFDFPDELDPLWVPNNPERSHLFNGLSLTMPYLEPYLIESMQNATQSIDNEELLDDILSGLDLPISRAEEKVGKPTSSSSGGGDFGSFARRFGSAAAASSAAEGSGADGGSFVIHGADGRGGRTKVIRAAGSAR